MTIAVISDVHGNIAALEAVLTDIARRGIRQIVNLGDCFSGPFDARATAERLIALNIPTVRGNHDRALYDGSPGLWEDWVLDDLTAEDIAWTRALPLVAEEHGLFLCHATPSSDNEDWLDRRGADHRLVHRDLGDVLQRAAGVTHPIMLCGHTHNPRVLRLPDGRVIVNPGAVGCPAYLDSRKQPNFIHQTGAPDARYAIVERIGGIWRADLVAVPYDSSAMIRLARARGADSWARAVSTGWVL